MKKITFCFILFISWLGLAAQTPNWAVNENEYQYTMTFVAKLNADGKRLTNSRDKVAAFVGSSCRGLSGVTYVAKEKSYYAYLTVFSNKPGELIAFKLYDSETNKISTVTKQIPFEINEHKGNLFQSYSIAEPALNSQAELLSFSFFNVKNLTSVITNGSVKIDLTGNYPITNLKPEFTLSKGASLFKNRIVQMSGDLSQDFSSAITYEVLSEDESNLNEYTVSVRQVSSATLFYKKDAVCYAHGAIKITSKLEGTTAKITKSGKTVATSQIINGEALFLNLGAGTYVATLGDELKIINILMKVK